MLKSKPFSKINYYEALRTAAGLWEHQVTFIWMGDGVYAALKDVDTSLTSRYFSELPDAGITLFAEEEALKERGFDADDLMEGVAVANATKISELLGDAQVTLVF